MSICKCFLIPFLLFVFIQFESSGQAARTPFSSFGLGDRYGNGLVQNQGMAGVGVAIPEYWHLNNINPSLLVYNSITVFQAGFVGEQRTVKGATASEQSGNGNLNYLALGFPIKHNKWGMGIGLMPFTGVNYKINYISPVENSASTIDVEEKGSGGINQIYLSNGVKLLPNLSIGLKTTYYFSGIVNEYSSRLSESNQVFRIGTNIYDRQSFTGFGFTAGAAFNLDSLLGNSRYQLNLGATYDIKGDMSTKFYERFERRSVDGILDSVTLINNLRGKTAIPQSLVVGASIGRNSQWVVGADFTYLDNSRYKDFSGAASGKSSGWELALGGKLTPDAGSVSNYFKRVTYRTGVSMSEAPYLINGNTLKDFGINFGLSLPVSRISSLDLAFKVGKRGDLQTNTIEENYFKLYFGVTFNDQWFIKRRFD